VKRGQVLVELDSRVERAQLSSAIARRDLARVSAGRSRALVAKDVTPQSELDSADATFKSASADVAALQAQIDRKIVRAPFDGRIGIRQVNLGQYLNPGAPVATLQAVDAVFIDFTLPQQQLSAVTTGSQVSVNADGAVLTGVIEAIEPAVDSATRALKLRASVKEQIDKLRPGMFVEVSVTVGTAARIVTVPAPAVVHAPYGDSIFIVEEGKARQQFVRTGETRGDFVAILEGVKPGQEVVVAGAFKLRNGAGVTINNTVKLDPKLAPRPENR
jgi:membrane fusion protein, multidrug efflux system